MQKALNLEEPASKSMTDTENIFKRLYSSARSQQRQTLSESRSTIISRRLLGRLALVEVESIN